MISDERLIVRGIWPLPFMFAAIVSASESTAAPHRIPNGYIKAGNFFGVPTYSLQHGVENIGLTYQDSEYGDVDFSAQTILTWTNPDRLPSFVAKSVRDRCVATGRPACLHSNPLSGSPVIDQPYVLVTENLHWNRYSDAYRTAFKEMVHEIAKQHPDHLVIIHPHPAGQWARQNRLEFDPTSNIRIIPDEQTDLAPSLHSLLQGAEMLIATASTTALDAALAGTPVAVFAHDMDLPTYSPLPMLSSAVDLVNFIQSPSINANCVRRFLDQTVMHGDGAELIIDRITMDVLNLPVSV